MPRPVATERTLEQKISDAGPNNQRAEPLILTEARTRLMKEDRIRLIKRGKTPWFYLAETADEVVRARLDILGPIYDRTQDDAFTQRVGQALEIAVFKALKDSGRDFLGSYSNLSEHDDTTLYDRVDPPLVISGNKIEKGPLDFVVFEPSGGAGIEVKNYRSWIYPDTTEVKDLLSKCADAKIVPVLVARRRAGRWRKGTISRVGARYDLYVCRSSMGSWLNLSKSLKAMDLVFVNT